MHLAWFTRQVTVFYLLALLGDAFTNEERIFPKNVNFSNLFIKRKTCSLNTLED